MRGLPGRFWQAMLGMGGIALLAGQEARAQSLRDALAAAYDGNPQLLGERATARATDEAVPQALSGWRPTVSINADAGLSHESSQGGPASITALPPTLDSALGGLNTGSTRPTDYSISISQPLFTGGHATAATAQALARVRAEHANLVAVEEAVLLAAATDYVNVVADQATLDLAIGNVAVYRRELDYTEDRLKVGEVTRTDVAQAEASLAQAIAGRQQAETALQIARATFRQDIGLVPGRLPAPDVTPDLPASRDAAITIARGANPSVIAAQFTAEAAEDDIRVVRSALLPTVSLTATAGRSNSATSAGVETDSESLTATMTVPLYEGGQVYSESREAQETLVADREKLDQQRLAAMQSAASAWEQVREARANIVSYQAQIDANAIALDGVRQEAGVGERTVLDVLNAEQTLFQSKVNLVQSRHDELIAQFTLADALGRLTAAGLGLAVRPYDPDKNFDAVKNKWIGFGTGQ